MIGYKLRHGLVLSCALLPLLRYKQGGVIVTLLLYDQRLGKATYSRWRHGDVTDMVGWQVSSETQYFSLAW